MTSFRPVKVLPVGLQHQSLVLPRILHVISTLSAGGAPRGVLEIVGEQERRGECEVQLCVLGGPQEAAPHDHLQHRPVFLDCPVHIRGRAWQRWESLRRVLKTHQPAIVHSHLWPSAAQVNLAGIGIAFHHVNHIRDTPPSFGVSSWRGRARRQWLKCQLALRDISYIAVSRAAKDYTHDRLGISAEAIRVVLNGVDLRTYTTASRSAGCSEVVIGTAGRQIVDKGQHLLIAAVARLHHAGLPVRLRLAGIGGQRDDLERLAHELAVSDRVEFVGQVADMPGFLSSLDVFALPSLAAEGLPRVLLEAMASGVATVAFNCAGVDEVLTTGEGIIVPVGDVDALAGAMRMLVTDPGLRSQLATAGQARVHQLFSVERVAADISAVYRELLDAR